MEFFLNLNITPPETQVDHQHPILLTGSCFTEHIGDHLASLKFNTLQNPNGIVFDTASVCESLISYMQNRPLNPADMFELDGLWHNWKYHTRYSHPDKETAMAGMNKSISQAHDFLARAEWLIITLGTSYSYRLADSGMPVANCHRAPSQWFSRHLLGIDENISLLDNMLYRLFQFNPRIKVVFTVSPVRHIRDGMVENNRSKARLIETVHHLVQKFDRLYYFPAYELVIDVLRDYRFYDTDLVHPNYAATGFVLEKFAENFINAPSLALMQEIRKVNIARKHRPQHPDTPQHRRFLAIQLEKTLELQRLHPWLDLEEELVYFGGISQCDN